MTERISIYPDNRNSLIAAAKQLGIPLAKLEQAIIVALAHAARSLRPTAEILHAEMLRLAEALPGKCKEGLDELEVLVHAPVIPSSMRPVPRRRGRPRQLASSYG